MSRVRPKVVVTRRLPEPVETRMRARITVPDMAAYRGNWERSIVRVTFGTDPANSETADIPAPPPGGR